VAEQERVAGIQPLDVTGTRTLYIGTLVWSLALIAGIPLYGTLRDDGRGWWLWTCAAGVGLGLFGIAYCKRRERALCSGSQSADSSPIGAAGL
jgi:hypothetical protein